MVRIDSASGTIRSGPRSVSYRVLIQPQASEDIEAAYGRSHERAAASLNGAFSAIESLTEFPRRCALAPEDEVFDPEIRHLLHGGFRILFTVQEDQLRILHIRHGARRPLGPSDAE